MQNKDIETTIRDLTEEPKLSNSQIDRMVDPKMLLVGYLSTYVSKVQTEDDLLQKLRNRFEDRLDDDNLSDAMALRIFEVLSKKQSEDNAPLLNLFAKALENPKKGKEENDSSESKGGDGHKESSFTKEDIASAKKFLQTIQAIEAGESSEKELAEKK